MKQDAQLTAVEWLYDWMWTKDHHYFLEGDLALAFSKAQLMEKEQKIEFACKVVEVSAEKYIQGKTTEQIAEELIK